MSERLRQVKQQRNYLNAKILEVRPLTEADLVHLRSRSVGAPRIQKLRDSHHNVARLFASGLKLSEISRATGYSISALSQIQRDPSTANLIAHYRALATEDWLMEQDELAANAIRNLRKAERQIGDHLDDADSEGRLLPMRELLAITSDRMDRFGYGKHTQATNINIDYAAALERAIQEKEKLLKKVAAE